MHDLPIWFLVFSIIVPRLALFVGWYHGWTFGVPQPGAAFCWLLLPRVLTLMLIYTAQGFSPWFWIHLAIAIYVWVKSGCSTTSKPEKAAQ